jgi:acyl-CoA thioester hydrolase
MKVRIYYHHTDCGGVVYYAEYLKFLEEARTEFFETKGLSIERLKKEGLMFVVYQQEMDYKLPVFYADTLQISAYATRVSPARVEFEYEIKNQKNNVVATAKTVLACVDNGLKPKIIPAEIRKKIGCRTL